MFNKTVLKSSLLLVITSLISACPTTTVVNPPSDISPQVSSSQNTSTSSKDESKKPEPYISTDKNSASTSSGALAGSPGRFSEEPMSDSALAPTIIADGSASSGSGPLAAPMSETGVTSDSASKPSSSTGTFSSQPIQPLPQAKKLSAGDIDDNLKFSDYLSYINSITGLSSQDIIKADVSNRYIISVKDKDGKSIPDTSIQISVNGTNVFSGKTYSNGKLIFMPSANNNLNSNCQQQNCDLTYTLTAQKDNDKISKEFTSSTDSKNWDIQLTNQRQISETINLDLNFLVDATGSMGDEINSIQKTIKDIALRINQISDKKLKIRYSLVSYKDKNDSYRVKRYDFTTNLEAYQEILNDLSAGGGGDYKEALNEGLSNSVSKITWTNNTDAIRLIFLIADAPPHLDYSDDIKYPESIKEAIKQGIKIYPVASSGLDPSGEYIFRQLAQSTYAKFLFITYGGDEQTPGTTSHNVGIFKENNLDDLVVNIVKEEISQFSE